MSEMILTLGLAPDGTPVRFDLARLAHLFIGGVAGSGKTYCIESLLAQLPENVQTIRIDTSDEEAALASLRSAVEELNARLEAFQAAGVRQISQYPQPLQRMVLALDEYAPLMHKHHAETEQLLTRIAQLGRMTGIHLLISTQRPQPEVLTGLIKANFPSRIALRTATADHSRALLDHTGAEKLPRPGDLLFYPIGAESPVAVHVN